MVSWASSELRLIVQVMSKELKLHIGSIVRSARLHKEMTQAQLAESVDKTFETISNMERGVTMPNLSTLSDIADILGLPIKEFFPKGDEHLSEERRVLLAELTLISAQLDDEQFSKLVEIAKILGKND